MMIRFLTDIRLRKTIPHVSADRRWIRTHRLGYRFVLACIVSWVVGSSADAQSDRESIKFFETSIRPMLAEHCYRCHGPKEQEGQLRLDHISFIRNGGESGAAIESSDPDESLLIQAVRYESGLEMPPDEPLSSDDVKLLERWVAMGSPWPDETVVDEARDAQGFSERDRQWWAIQPVVDPAVPSTGGTWAINPIDHFVAAKHQELGLDPAPRANSDELVRRAYFDLHGVPPTPEQVRQFAADSSPDAWPRLIDRLLESPRYGERWAQHWLDVVRYAESDGYRQDAYRPTANVYRDYVIQSLNDDKPYDRFVREHLAGDELFPDDPDSYIGTAFLRHGVYEYNQRNAKMHWELIVNEMTNVTGEAFLGISIGCAQCHNHKFDPILQKDYYALQAFLASVCWPTDMPLADKSIRADHDAKQQAWEKATAEIRAQIDEMLASARHGKQRAVVKQFPEDIQQMYAKPRSQRSTYEQQLVMLVERQIDYDSVAAAAEKSFAKKPEQLKRYQELKKQLAQWDHLKPAPLPNAFAATDVCCEPAQVTMKTRTDELAVEPDFLTLLGQKPPTIRPTDQTTGRRTALANWIASPDNPLSTRVIVNRLWQHHFGKGIVSTPNDLGNLGEAPSHPELLDWLTRRFVENQWTFKSMHRLIMTSATYMQSARREPTPKLRIADPGNRFLWRFPPMRLDAEQRRDAMLAASGELKPAALRESQSGSSTVRSLYVKKIRNSPDHELYMMDAPMGFESTATRPPTTTPIQALSMVNGDWTIKRAGAMARRLLADCSLPSNASTIPPSVIERAYWLVYSRQASEAETAMALQFASDRMNEPTPAGAPEFKYPKENGLRVASAAFGKIDSHLLRRQALWLQPESRFERLQIEAAAVDQSFTIEAIATLDRVYADATVNTLVSRWNNNPASPGWSLGVTSEKSRYKPRNIIVQLIGNNAQGKMTYEVIASDLHFPLNKPAYVAAWIDVPQALSNNEDKSKDARTGGTVTFHFRDLSDPQSQLQTVVRKHSIVGPIQNPQTRTLVGGRDHGGHLWDGQLARLAFAQGELPENKLLVNHTAQGGPVERLVDFDFELTGDNLAPSPGTQWVANQHTDSKKNESQLLAALTDLCHVLLTSNEFLYLH